MSTTATEKLPAGSGTATSPFPAAIDAIVPRLSAGLKPLLLLIGVAAAVAVGVSVVLWTRGSTYSLLYANLPVEDQAAITQALDAAGIPNKLNADGSGILVPQERLGEARLKLAGQGLPGNDDGFAIITKDPGLGVSQFVEDARYQHAMETELAHTISSLRPVAGARVHIAASRDSAFVRDRHPASASVFLQLRPGRRLEQEQVRAIVNLVASSVPEMDPRQVTVVDQLGHLLNSPEAANDPAARTDEELRQVQRIEDDYQQRVESILTPILGSGHVHAQVVAQLDTAVTEQAREQYRPGSQIVRSEQTSEQINHDGNANQGVPGSLSNQPPAAGMAQAPPATRPATPATGNANAAAGTAAQAAPQAAADAQAGAGAQNVSRQETRNYEMDRTVDYTQQPAGGIKRLTVAVVVDDVHSMVKGKDVHHPLSESEIDHLTTLVKNAVGFQESRGDSVSVINASFQTDTPADVSVDKVPFWQTPLFQDLAKLGAGVLVLLVLSLGVLRPLIRGLVGTPRSGGRPVAGQPMLAGAEVMPDSVQLTPAARAALPPAADESAAEQARSATEAHEKQVQDARAIVNQDPKLVAQVVHTWVSDDE